MGEPVSSSIRIYLNVNREKYIAFEKSKAFVETCPENLRGQYNLKTV